jgi:hypothetical protein
MKTKRWFILLILFGACKDKYMPNIHNPATGFLVVEGFINSGTGPSTFTLTRTSSIDSMAIIPESGAMVEVQSGNGASYPLAEQAGGTYTITQVPIDPTQMYWLHIKTSNGKEYLSDSEVVKITPPIDSVGWKAGSDNLSIYASTHDDQAKSIYYKWQYEETWIYNSAYVSRYEFRRSDTSVITRLNPDSLFTCWLSNNSSDILLSSSANLNSDIIYQFPLTMIPYSTTNRLISRYSILVKESALTKDWYEWEQNLKKNTEQLGSIFDAQPSETGGNIHCLTDPTEQVVGFIGCTSQTEKRIFIDRSELPPVQIYSGYEFCSIDSVADNKPALVIAFGDGGQVPIDIISIMGGITGYSASSTGCVDCRTMGGTTVKPAFWY